MALRLLIIIPLVMACGGKGADGVDGQDGSPGVPGSDGETGSPGEDGAPGPSGADGTDGEDGEDGQDCWDTNGDGLPDVDEDTNGDGEVNIEDCVGDDDDAETDSIYLGDLHLREAEQAQYFCDHYDSILGALTIDAWDADLTDLVCLESVSQDLTINGGLMTSVSLPNLTTVGGRLSIQASYTQAVRFVSLTNINGLLLDQTGLFSSTPLIVSFPSLLESLGENDFTLTSNGMQTIDFSNLTLVEGGFRIQNNSTLNALTGLDSLAVVNGNFSIENNAVLCETAAWTLVSAVTIGGSISISENIGPCP